MALIKRLYECLSAFAKFRQAFTKTRPVRQLSSCQCPPSAQIQSLRAQVVGRKCACTISFGIVACARPDLSHCKWQFAATSRSAKACWCAELLNLPTCMMTRKTETLVAMESLTANYDRVWASAGTCLLWDSYPQYDTITREGYICSPVKSPKIQLYTGRKASSESNCKVCCKHK